MNSSLSILVYTAFILQFKCNQNIVSEALCRGNGTHVLVTFQKSNFGMSQVNI